MSTQLQGDQYPKGLTEEQVRAIAREEATNALIALKNAIGDTPQRADGNLNARDFLQTVELAEIKMQP